MLRYNQIKKYDIANGSYLRTSIWFTGCNFHCKGCFNYELWDFKSGNEFTEDVKQYVFDLISDKHCKGLSILGGEPLQQDLDELLSFINEFKEKFPNKDLWLWTGYYLSELNDKQKEVISLCDYVVDGRFEEDKSGLNLKFRGSSNQTIWENKNGEFIKSKLND